MKDLSSRNNNAPGPDKENGFANLLVSQAETADLVVLTKVELIWTIVMARGQGVAMAGAVDDHRDAVLAARMAEKETMEKANDVTTHVPTITITTDYCVEPNCTSQI
jgi:G3E family GTPase